MPDDLDKVKIRYEQALYEYYRRQYSVSDTALRSLREETEKIEEIIDLFEDIDLTEKKSRRNKKHMTTTMM